MKSIELKDNEVREIEKVVELKTKKESVKSTLSDAPKKRPGRPKKSETAVEKKKTELEKAPGVLGVGRPPKLILRRIRDKEGTWV